MLDVGANLGTSAMLFSEQTGPSGHVYSFEPVFHDLLTTNIRENGIENVTVIPQGAWSRSGVEAFTITDRGIDSRADSIGDRGIRKLVDVISLDEFAEQERLERVDEGDPQHPKLVALLEEHGYRVKEIGQTHIYAW